MKKIKIPFLSKEDIQTQTANTDILRSYATNSFIEKNLGKKGSDEFADYFADIVVENKIILELKCCTNIDNSHIAQLINYLTATDIVVGYILNFGNDKKLQFKRIVK